MAYIMTYGIYYITSSDGVYYMWRINILLPMIQWPIFHITMTYIVAYDLYWCMAYDLWRILYGLWRHPILYDTSVYGVWRMAYITVTYGVWQP
jgi:hypothetical protein